MSRLALKLGLFLAVALMVSAVLPNSAEAHRRRHVVHATPVYTTDFWGRCYVRKYTVWWLQMCPAQRLAVAQGYVIR